MSLNNLFLFCCFFSSFTKLQKLFESRNKSIRYIADCYVRKITTMICQFVSQDACFYSANDDDSIVYFAHCISRTGTYLSEAAGVREGTAMAYLIAPPLEAMVGLDAALKAAQVELKVFYGPPSETNFAGGLLTGDQAACKAACEAFAEAVNNIADHPLIY